MMATAPLEGAMSSRAAAAPPSTRRTLVTTGVGNALEWYDWGIYATFSIYFATEIFAPHDPVAAILGAMAVFAVGFVVRPLGGLVFGWLADRRGRRASMVLTVGLASFGSLMIALVPTYESAGVGAPVLLLLARVLQGLAHGGEMPTAQTYLAEMAPRERRGRWASLIYVSGTSGVLAGMLMGVILDLMLSEQDMSAWGWRIPFLVGAVLGVWALISRVLLAESPHYQDERRTRRSAGRRPSALRPMLAGHWRESVQVVGLVVGGTVCYYVWSVSAMQQAVVVHGMSPGTALQASLVSNLILIFTLPLWGALSDRVGRRPVLAIGNLAPAVLFLPMNALVGSSFLSLFLPATVMLVLLGAVLAVMPAALPELFPTQIRTLGAALPYAVAVAAFGGTAPYLQNWISITYSVTAFSVYVIVLLLISTGVALTLPETRARDLTA